ncbi:retropepsin-like aspartic protease [Acetobacter cibinongensis]|nr:retropepsin-like aspartic protease [Acetobacter cibinongensis]
MRAFFRSSHAVLGGRMPNLKTLLLGAMLASLAACAAPEEHGCRVGTLGTLPVLNTHGSPLVHVTINGRRVIMLVDSGAEFSTLSRRAVKTLGLSALPGDLWMHGVGGSYAAIPYKIDTLGLGTGTTHDVLVLDSPGDIGTFHGEPVVGLFGSDFLSSYDVVFDLQKQTINLYDEVKDCPSPTPLWDGPNAKVDMVPEDHNRIGLNIKLNNTRSIDALLDSGAFRTVVTERHAHRAGVTQEQLEANPLSISGGIDEHKVRGHVHRFSSLQIGTETFDQPVLEVSRIKTDGTALLGADFLRHNRVWVSRHDRAIYFQRLVTPPQKDMTFEQSVPADPIKRRAEVPQPPPSLVRKTQ